MLVPAMEQYVAVPLSSTSFVVLFVKVYTGPAYARLDYREEARSIVDFHARRFVDREPELAVSRSFSSGPRPVI